MNELWQFLSTLTVGEWAVILVGVATVLENVSKLKVWSWLFGLIGDKLNAKLTGEVEALKKAVIDVKADVDDSRFKTCKGQILDFARSDINGKNNTREQYAHILEIIDEYEVRFADKHNGELKQTVAFIKDDYQRFCKTSAQEGRKKNKPKAAAVAVN